MYLIYPYFCQLLVINDYAKVINVAVNLSQILPHKAAFGQFFSLFGKCVTESPVFSYVDTNRNFYVACKME